MNEAKRIQKELASDQLDLRGHYAIAATHMLASNFLAPVWLGIQETHPALTATLNSLRSGELLSRVNLGEIDLGFCFSPASSSNYEQERIYEGKLLLCFGTKHPFLKDPKVENLSKYSSVAAKSSPGIDNCENHPEFKRFGIQLRTVNLFDNYEVAIAALRSNQVWALIPDILAFQHHHELETYAPPGWQAEFYISGVWPKHRVRSPAMDLVMKKMTEIVNGHRNAELG